MIRRDIETACAKAVSLAFAGVEEASMAAARVTVAPSTHYALDTRPLLVRAIACFDAALAELREAKAKLDALGQAQLCGARSAALGRSE